MSKDSIPELNFVDMSVDFATLMNGSEKKTTNALKPGDKCTGTVSMITESGIFFELNGKSEGIIPRMEFVKDGELLVAVGDEISAYFVNEDGGELSFTLRMSGDALHETIGQAYISQIPVEGKVVEEKKGGYTVNLSGITAFCPYSQIDIRPQDPQQYIGKVLSFIITKMTDFDVVVSRRPIVQEEANIRKAELVESLSEGDEVDGVVRKIESFGVFVDIGGVDGLIPMGEISWERNFDINSIVRPGDQVKVTVRRLDWDKDRIVLSLRESAGNPWNEIDNLHLNTAYDGLVTKVESYGAFVQLPGGIEGLLHISKIGKGKRLAHASEVVSVGDKLEVFITEVNSESRRISLSLEEDNHAIEGHEKSGVPTGHSNAITVGNKLTGKVDGIKNFGIFVMLNESRKGLIHVSLLDVPPNAESMSYLGKKYNLGDDIEVEVLHMEDGRISLGLPGTNSEAESRVSIQKYLQKKTDSSSSFGSLGDVFGGLNF